MNSSHLSCAIALQAALDREQDANRILRNRVRELESEREQLRLMLEKLQRDGWRKPLEQDDLAHD